MKKPRVLVVDDEEQIRRAVGRALTARGYEVDDARDGEEALTVATASDPDLVVLDLNLPALDGLSVCQQLRRRSSVPILVLSVREDESDKVAALDLGADDYLTKPFGIGELMARVRALLRRAETRGEPRPLRFRTDDLEIDLDARLVVRGGEKVRLTKTEWGLLEALSEHPGKLLTQHLPVTGPQGGQRPGQPRPEGIGIGSILRGLEPGVGNGIDARAGVGEKLPPLTPPVMPEQVPGDPEEPGPRALVAGVVGIPPPEGDGRRSLEQGRPRGQGPTGGRDIGGWSRSADRRSARTPSRHRPRRR